jgi:hypothetical protein
MGKLAITIRIVLTLTMVVFSYRETGVFTALSLFLIFMAIEALTFLIKQIKGKIDAEAIG